MAETYAGWLTSPENTARRDVTGALARAWKQTEGSRPKRSGIDGLTRWFTDEANLAAINERSSRELTAGEVAEAAHTAAAEYRRQRAAEALDLVPGEGSEAEVMHPVVMDTLQQADRAATGEILSVIYGQLSRIEGELPVLRSLLERTEGRLDVVLAWQATQDQRIAPVTALLDELRSAGFGTAGPELSDAYGRPWSRLPGEVHAWHDGMHMIHCRDDRCNGGRSCNCPCHAIFEAPGQEPVVFGHAAACPSRNGGQCTCGQPVLPETVYEVVPAQTVLSAVEPAAELRTDAPATPGPGWTYAGPVEGGGFLWTAPAGTPLPAAIGNMPPGETREKAESAYRAVYPEPQPDEAVQQAGPAANGLYGGHER
jgi:hypothetical protein